MKAQYVEPPMFTVDKLIAEGEYVTATGSISLKDETGKMIECAYCDVWRFRQGKLAQLKAFVINTFTKQE